MSPLLEQITAFFVVLTLTVVFTWTYLRAPEPRGKWWLFGWISTLVHFAAKVVLCGDLLPYRRLSEWLAVITLHVAGSCFLLSVYKSSQLTRGRIFFLAPIAIPSVLYTTVEAFQPGQIWIYQVILVLALIITLALLVTHLKSNRGRLLGCCIFVLMTMFALYWLSATRYWFTGDCLFLTEYFTVAGILYWRHFRQASPGIMITSISLIAWGLVFPIFLFLWFIHKAPAGDSAVWDIPKYFAAFGTVLSLFEDNARRATNHLSLRVYRYLQSVPSGQWRSTSLAYLCNVVDPDMNVVAEHIRTLWKADCLDLSKWRPELGDAVLYDDKSNDLKFFLDGSFQAKLTAKGQRQFEILEESNNMTQQSLTLPTSGFMEGGTHLQVFICHSSQDKEAARTLYSRLRRDGFAPWLDEENILPGQDWEYEIAQAVRQSHAVVVCLSQSSTTKEGYIHKEIRLALDVAEEKPSGAIFIIPTRLETCNVPERLRGWQWVNIFEERGYNRLVAALRARAAQLDAACEPSARARTSIVSGLIAENSSISK